MDASRDSGRELGKDPGAVLHRELDPAVFGGAPNPSGAHFGSGAAAPGGSVLNYGLQPPPASPQTRPGAPVPFPSIDFKVLEAQVQQVKAVLGQFERRLDQLTARQNELARDSQSRLDRLDNQMIRLEDGISRLTNDTSQRVAALAARINERKVSDTKVQELMDRHNLMVRNFENRLSAMQKLAADQEQALLSAFAALEDARAELARLKRI
jgi:hypothetical protein